MLHGPDRQSGNGAEAALFERPARGLGGDWRPFDDSSREPEIPGTRVSVYDARDEAMTVFLPCSGNKPSAPAAALRFAAKGDRIPTHTSMASAIAGVYLHVLNCIYKGVSVPGLHNNAYLNPKEFPKCFRDTTSSI